MKSPTDTLAEYDALLIREQKLLEELEAIRARRAELRRVLIGDAAVGTPPTHETRDEKNKSVKSLSSWERLGRKPTLAIGAVVDFVKARGKATNGEVATALGISIQLASLRLSVATKQKWLRRVSQGVYEIDPLGGSMVVGD